MKGEYENDLFGFFAGKTEEIATIHVHVFHVKILIYYLQRFASTGYSFKKISFDICNDTEYTVDTLL
jgi:hypothetical protein